MENKKKNDAEVIQASNETKLKKRSGKKLFMMFVTVMMFAMILSVSVFASDGTATTSAGADTISTFLTALGDGISAFLPDIATAGVSVVDILFVKSDGSLTTLAVLTIIGAVFAAGLGVFSLIKRKMAKV